MIHSYQGLVGTLPKSEFLDARQGWTLQAGIPQAYCAKSVLHLCLHLAAVGAGEYTS